jgi:hypothetical protein
MKRSCHACHDLALWPLPFFEQVFYHLGMSSPDPDRLRYAQIAGAAARHAWGWRLTADEEAAAIAELAEAAAGRADLLAERAGTALGFGEGRPDAARYQQIAELCIAAGADQALIGRWIKVGRERAAAAAAIPYTGLPPGALMLLRTGGGFRCRAGHAGAREQRQGEVADRGAKPGCAATSTPLTVALLRWPEMLTSTSQASRLASPILAGGFGDGRLSSGRPGAPGSA